jgi:sulfur-carrier protein adenylyltransferase/sulfurtransferase
MAIKSGTDMINEARARNKEVTVKEVREMQACGEEPVFLDCREPNEWNLGHLPGAVLLPRGVMEQNIEARISRDKKVIIYCASGNRSLLAADTLRLMGYEDVASLAGGIKAWAYEGGELEG